MVLAQGLCEVEVMLLASMTVTSEGSSDERAAAKLTYIVVAGPHWQLVRDFSSLSQETLHWLSDLKVVSGLSQNV